MVLFLPNKNGPYKQSCCCKLLELFLKFFFAANFLSNPVVANSEEPRATTRRNRWHSSGNSRIVARIRCVNRGEPENEIHEISATDADDIRTLAGSFCSKR